MLGAVEGAKRPRVRLLPVTGASVDRVVDLAELDYVEIPQPIGPSRLREPVLLSRRASRRWIQPLARRPLHRAFRGLDVSYPGFGTAIPGTPQMEWIPDFQHVHLPHLFSTEQIQNRDERFRYIADRPGIVILSSEAARDDFVKVFPNARATARVWRFCTTLTEHERSQDDPRGLVDVPDSYLYVANQFWAHKEHLTLFRALVLLRDRGVSPNVVCSGLMEDARDPSYVPSLLRFLEEHDLTDQVRLLGFLKRSEQIAVLRCCAAVVQPSSFEGWSTVVEDTKAVGRPLILSDIPVHLEQAPDARFFSVGSPESLADVIEAAMPELEPGPDPSAERAADEATRVRRRELGHAFVSIAEEAIALGAR